MYNAAKPVVKFSVSERLHLPDRVKRSESAALISTLFGTPASAFSAASPTARRDTFVSQCAALALSAMIHGDTSRLERIERYATTLPEYKKSKAGEISGQIGKLILAYREACAFGASVRTNPDFDQNADQIDLSRWLGQSPVFGGLIAAPKVQPKAVAKVASAPASAPAGAPEPKGLPTSVIKALASVELAECEYPHAANSTCGSFDHGNGHALAAMREREIARKATNTELPKLDIRNQFFSLASDAKVALLIELAGQCGYTLRKIPVRKSA